MKTFNEKLVEAFELNSLGDLLDSEKVTKFEKLAKLLVDTNKITNLTAITDDDGIILKHFVDCASVVYYSYIQQYLYCHFNHNAKC